MEQRLVFRHSISSVLVYFTFYLFYLCSETNVKTVFHLFTSIFGLECVLSKPCKLFENGDI